MEKLRALIVDDEQDAQEVLKFILTKYCNNVEIVGIASNANAAYDIICNKKPNVLLLDIQIASQDSSENSFDLLKRIPDYDYNIVFVTAYDKYAIQAIKIHAFDYLLKPVDVNELVNVLDEIQQQTRNDNQVDRINGLLDSVTSNYNNNDSIWLNTIKGYLKIDLESIIYIKSIEKYIEIQLKEEKLFINQSLKEMLGLLPKETFYKVHRSFIVNVSNVKELKKDRGEIYLVFNEETIPVSRRNKAEFLRILNMNSNL